MFPGRNGAGHMGPSKVRIAAFDLGSTWACAKNYLGGGIVFHVREAAKAKRPEKLSEFAEHISRGLLRNVDVVVFERPFARGQAATRLLWGMAGVLEAAAHTDRAAVLDMAPTEIKKWAAGGGKASKEEMIAAAQRMGYDGEDEHEADAWCLLKYAEATLTKEPA